jgi:hypothetical protein
MPAAVGVQLLQHEGREAGPVPDYFAIELVLTGHQELEHHEVRGRDVWRILRSVTTLLGILLAGVARKM